MLVQPQKKQPLPQTQRTKVTLQNIPGGVAGTRATLREMNKLVQQAKRRFPLRELALSIVQPAPPKCWSCEAKLIQEWVINNIRYVRDIDGIETIAIPEKTIELRSGDCDDLCVLAATLLQMVGHPVRFVAVGFNGKPASHVLLETQIGDKWVPIELTEPYPFGQYPPGITSRLVEHIKL